MSDIFVSTTQLKDVFEIDSAEQYINFMPYENKIGFSVLREYPANSRFKPPVTKSGPPDSLALIGIRYDPTLVDSKKPKLVPITVRASVFSRYLSKHEDYYFNKEDCPTEESIIASKKTPRPVDLISHGEVFYDHEQETFIDKEGNKLKGIEIINDIFEQHLATVDKIKGKIFRLKIRSFSAAEHIIVHLEKFCISLMRLLCGQTYQPDDPWRGVLEPYQPKDLKLLSTERIDVFGYRASKNIILVFCIILLFGYLFMKLLFNIPSWIKTIAANSLLSFAFAITLISTLDYLLPKILFFLVNKLLMARIQLINVNVKFK